MRQRRIRIEAIGELHRLPPSLRRLLEDIGDAQRAVESACGKVVVAAEEEKTSAAAAGGGGGAHRARGGAGPDADLTFRVSAAEKADKPQSVHVADDAALLASDLPAPISQPSCDPAAFLACASDRRTAETADSSAAGADTVSEKTEGVAPGPGTSPWAMTLVLALSYGGRAEIVAAARALATQVACAASLRFVSHRTFSY